MDFDFEHKDEKECSKSKFGVFGFKNGARPKKGRIPCPNRLTDFDGKYELKFTIKYEGNTSGWGNVFRFTNNENGDATNKGNRVLAMFIYKNARPHFVTEI